jgi:predicted phosphodiesterase
VLSRRAAGQAVLPPEPSRLLVAGDSHGNLGHLQYLIAWAQESGCDAILHLGDFGYWPKWSDYLEYGRELLEQAALPLYFVEGNHEQYVDLYKPHPEVGSFRLVVPPGVPGRAGIWHIPRGTRWRWQGIRFLGVGGAYSIDKELRGPGIDWFPEELLSDEEYQRIVADPDQVDICVFHDAPRGAPLPLELLPIFKAAWNRELLGKIAAHVRPALILHAHYHCFYISSWRDEGADVSAAIVGLDSDLNPSRSWLVLDLDEARAQLSQWRGGGPPTALEPPSLDR